LRETHQNGVQRSIAQDCFGLQVIPTLAVAQPICPAVESKQKTADYAELFRTLKQKSSCCDNCSTIEFLLGYTQPINQRFYP
jgi:hypothetical protein